MTIHTDVLVIGSGIAGATAALKLAEDSQRQITLVTRAEQPDESSSKYAQGGIVGRGENDSAALLEKDILRAGVDMNYIPAVRLLAELGPSVVNEVLVEKTTLQFDRDKIGHLSYGLEAAHSTNRVLHVGDSTGRAIMQGLIDVLASKPNVQVLTQQTAVDLITFPHHSNQPTDVYEPVTCYGAYVYNREDHKVVRILAVDTVLATGGLGQIFLNTTNPVGARGDGLAMAYRAGVRVANLEYIQFHPTALHMAGGTKFLISEAVRGEGGVLLTPDGKPFMHKVDPEWKDLAPRDVVARAIYWQMLAYDHPFMLLDISSKMKAEDIQTRFPTIYRQCLSQNIDITHQPIPVVPAAHYFCGGVIADLWGRTTVPGLYAIGEVSCTGVHGANRLASTSLLEGVVWGVRVAEEIRSKVTRSIISEDRICPWDVSGLIYDADPQLIQGDMQNIRNLMWHYVGLIRSEYRLRRAVRELRHLWFEIEEFYRKTRLSDDLIGLRNSVMVALTVARAARRNKISRGCHYREEGEPESPFYLPR